MRIILIIIITAVSLILSGCQNGVAEETVQTSETTETTSLIPEDYSHVLVRRWTEADMLGSVVYDDVNEDKITSVLGVEIGVSHDEMRAQFGIPDGISGDYEEGNFALIYLGNNFDSLTVYFESYRVTAFALVVKTEEEPAPEDLFPYPLPQLPPKDVVIEEN